jgi:hypothetical protein
MSATWTNFVRYCKRNSWRVFGLLLAILLLLWICFRGVYHEATWTHSQWVDFWRKSITTLVLVVLLMFILPRLKGVGSFLVLVIVAIIITETWRNGANWTKSIKDWTVEAVGPARTSTGQSLPYGWSEVKPSDLDLNPVEKATAGRRIWLQANEDEGAEKISTKLGPGFQYHIKEAPVTLDLTLTLPSTSNPTTIQLKRNGGQWFKVTGGGDITVTDSEVEDMMKYAQQIGASPIADGIKLKLYASFEK